MKKTYIQPNVLVVEMEVFSPILDSSLDMGKTTINSDGDYLGGSGENIGWNSSIWDDEE